MLGGKLQKRRCEVLQNNYKERVNGLWKFVAIALGSAETAIGVEQPELVDNKRGYNAKEFGRFFLSGHKRKSLQGTIHIFSVHPF